MKNFEIAKKHEDYIIEMRRHFHENPELSGQEFKTMEKICQELDSMGIEYVVIPNGGILAKIVGGKDGEKAVMLRADIDALPVQETPDNLKEGMRTCISKVPGVMHACGHDGHIAMLLGAAKVLTERKEEIEGTVYLCFERSEETSSEASADYIFAYIEKEGIEINSIYGTHLLATAPTGYVGINDGGMMAGAFVFGVEIEGAGGHGSRPDQANNPMDAFVAIYQRMQAIRVAKVNPFETCTYSIGQLQGGQAWNVIPQKLTFAGNMRTFDRDGAGMTFRREFEKAIVDICKAYDCKPTFLQWGLPGYGTVNDATHAQFARKVIAAEVGADCVGTVEPWMASESYSRYLLQWPGVFAFLGMQNDEKGVGAAHHNQAFDIDEDVLAKGAASAATYAIEYLKATDLPKGGRKVSFKEVLKNEGRDELIPVLYGE
ncbi:MAG: amidohydrolase [Oscillospiraceae bacterium]|nr:amidohydrolase [Oscillospiraceae bacterium]